MQKAIKSNSRMCLKKAAASKAKKNAHAAENNPFPNKPMILKEHSEPGELDATKPAPERKKERRPLVCILTAEERAQHSLDLARALKAKSSLEDQLKSAQADFKAKIAEKDATINKESGIVANGEEFREVLCEWILDTPVRGKKTLRRTDVAFKGSDVVEVWDMSKEDTQSLITFETPAKKGGQS